MASLKQIRQLRKIYEKKIRVELEAKAEELRDKEFEELKQHSQKHFETIKKHLKPRDYEVSIFYDEIRFKPKTKEARRILKKLYDEKDEIRAKYEEMKERLYDRHRELLNELDAWEIRQAERVLLKEDIEPFEIKW